MDSTPIAVTRFFRQDSKPTDAPDGARWLTESDGAGNDTASSYFYDAPSETWELDSAVGPSEPTAGTPVPGATWRDTANAVAKQYDGTSFTVLGVTSHQDLQEVQDDDHHTPPQDITNRSLDRFQANGNGTSVVPVGAYLKSITIDGNQGGINGTIHVLDGGNINVSISSGQQTYNNINGFVHMITFDGGGVDIPSCDIVATKP